MSGPLVVLVVGGSSGIGRAAARELAARGDHLVLCSRGKAALEAAAEECRGRGSGGRGSGGTGSVTALPLDVRDGAAVRDAVAEVLATHGRIDAVLHCAGVVCYGRFEDVPAEVFDGVLATNVHGAANVARAVLPVMRRQERGTLVLLGSVIGDIAVPGMTAYAVSKYALRSLGRQLAVENRDLPGVRVCVVSPGGVDTPIYRQAANYQGVAGRPPAPVTSAARAGHALVRALDRPRDRIGVGPANPLMRGAFTLAPKVFDALVGPLFRLVATKPGAVAPTAGNVLEPREELERVDGGEGQGFADLLANLRSR